MLPAPPPQMNLCCLHWPDGARFTYDLNRVPIEELWQMFPTYHFPNRATKLEPKDGSGPTIYLDAQAWRDVPMETQRGFLDKFNCSSVPLSEAVASGLCFDQLPSISLSLDLQGVEPEEQLQQDRALPLGHPLNFQKQYLDSKRRSESA